jgi:hypothetical protein
MSSPAAISPSQSNQFSASMPPRGERQGFKIGRNGRRYWIASQAERRDTMDFPDKSIELPGRGPLPKGDTEAERAELEEINRRCTEYTVRLNEWINQQQERAEDPEATRTRYDGTVRSGCRIFQEHPLSPFKLSMKFNTQKTCVSFLKLIEATGGHFMFRNVTVPLVQSWYTDWRAPDSPGDDEHVKRAHEGVSTFRQVVYFLAAMRKYDGVAQLAAELQLVQFKKAQAREQEMTYAQASAFVRAALELGQKGVIPAERGLYMAIGVAGQFETAERQRDIIGEWAPRGANRRMPSDIGMLDRGKEVWIGYFTWENVPGWRWRLKTFKSSFTKRGSHDLTRYPLLMPLLEAVPHDQRTGAIVKGEHGLPVRSRSYGNWFRQIATAAEIPPDVWNMDSRAGRASEAFAATGDIALIQRLLKHTSQQITWRYIRGGAGGSVNDQVAAATLRKRTADGDGTA